MKLTIEYMQVALIVSDRRQGLCLALGVLLLHTCPWQPRWQLTPTQTDFQD